MNEIHQKYLEKHKLVEWIIPLHQKNPIWRSGTQIAISVVRILANTSSKARFSCCFLSPVHVAMVTSDEGLASDQVGSDFRVVHELD